jgi:hypothetical protein
VHGNKHKKYETQVLALRIHSLSCVLTCLDHFLLRRRRRPFCFVRSGASTILDSAKLSKMAS